MISFIATIYNESDSIKLFLNSLLSQSMQPDEIVIVDAGSEDNTVGVVKSILNEGKIPWKVFQKKGNRSIGRNEAVKRATGNIIVASDAGCILNKNWLKNITYPFKDKSISVVAGYYLPKTNSVFEKCLAAYTCVMPDKLNKVNYLPSSRSVAFRKSAWKKVGGYPEELDTCEDLVFARNLKKSGLRFYVEDKSIVYWPQRKNLHEAFRQFYGYAKGDGQARYIRPQTPLLFGRYLVGLFLAVGGLIFHIDQMYISLLVLLLLYLLWVIQKNYRYVRVSEALFWLPILQITSDIAVMKGTFTGCLSKFTEE